MRYFWANQLIANSLSVDNIHHGFLQIAIHDAKVFDDLKEKLQILTFEKQEAEIKDINDENC